VNSAKRWFLHGLYFAFVCPYVGHAVTIYDEDKLFRNIASVTSFETCCAKCNVDVTLTRISKDEYRVVETYWA
jgi:hypothetical protein